jgi:hypothetical protein
MFERKREKLASVSVFVRRIAFSLIIAGVLILFALFIGIAGYHWIAGLDCVDALLDASMILGGMGLVNQLTSKSAKVFAAGYAFLADLYLSP